MSGWLGGFDLPLPLLPGLVFQGNRGELHVVDGRSRLCLFGFFLFTRRFRTAASTAGGWKCPLNPPLVCEKPTEHTQESPVSAP